MFSFFKKKNEVVEVEPIETVDREFNEVSNISVRDLKQHLVDGYDLEKKLEKEISVLKDKLELVNSNYSNQKEKFDALKVVADEKASSSAVNLSRLEQSQRDYENLEQRTSSRIDGLKERNNDLTIQLKQFEGKTFTQEDLNLEIKGFSETLKEFVNNHKGNLSKQQMLDYIENGD